MKSLTKKQKTIIAGCFVLALICVVAYVVVWVG